MYSLLERKMSSSNTNLALNIIHIATYYGNPVAFSVFQHPVLKIDFRHSVIIIHHSESHLAQQLCAVISLRSQESPLHTIFLLLPHTDSDRGFYNLWQLLGLQFADMTHTLSPVFVIHIDSLCQNGGCMLRQQSRKMITSLWPPVNHDIFAHEGVCNEN